MFRYRRPRDSKSLVKFDRDILKISEPKRFLQRAARLFGCLDCGEHHVSCLSFYLYHGNRLKAIRIRHCKTIDEVKHELSQGFVLCRNCNKKRSAPIHPSVSWIRSYKIGRGCSICAITDADVLEMHHLSEKTKHFDISKNQCSVPNYVLNKELEKIVVLCANCHSKEHS